MRVIALTLIPCKTHHWTNSFVKISTLRSMQYEILYLEILYLFEDGLNGLLYCLVSKENAINVYESCFITIGLIFFLLEKHLQLR